MSTWKRLFSADYRAAVSAEAAGQLEQAAEHYVLAGEPVEAARVHLSRAERADSRDAEIGALRDALHWVGEDTGLRARIQRVLGRALLGRARDEGIATARDRQRVRDAATLLLAGGDFGSAGEALEAIGDVEGAVQAFRRGGLIERMEALLGREADTAARERSVREAYANYEMHLRTGDRDQALAALEECVRAAERPASYRRLLDELSSRVLTGGRVLLHLRGAPALGVVAAGSAVLGRDPLCELPLRAGGVSRRHAEITVAAADAAPRFHLRDLGSRNGTRVGGMPVHGELGLRESGSFALGDHCDIDYELRGAPAHLQLTVSGGLDRERRLLLVGPGEGVALEHAAELPLRVWFRDGRPMLSRLDEAVRLTLDGVAVARGDIQLVRGDLIEVDGREIEVA
ncbi:FHA domain-containing protein [Haliangium ochraceum]|uniref:FHA domain-containing protein n=1 Tax=Haliangium ochraceum TaxID=80816 RepID=UPI00019BA1DE|nr:FHA domain-containing protein [Haliangium ochraceum]